MFYGCSTIPNNNYDLDLPRVNPIIKPLVVKFNKYYIKYRHSSLQNTIVVNFQPIDGSKKCQGVYYSDIDTTVISSEHWNDLSALQKEIVVFHELGHHVLKRGHQEFEPILHNKCYRSIMYKSGVTDDCYEESFDYYMEELFKRGK
jgi:hypothetical protein